MRRGLMTLLALHALGRGTPARAADEDSRPRQALAACSGGEVQKGIGILAELYAETREPAFVFNQGRCYQQNGELEKAADRFREYLRVGTNEPGADRDRAAGYLREIDETLARRRTEPRPADPARSTTMRGVTIGLGVLGVAALGTGAYLSSRVESQERAVEQRFGGNKLVTVAESRELRNQLSDGSRLETWQYVSYGVGIAALAGAATTIILTRTWPWSSETALVAAPVAWSDGAGAVVQGRF